MADYNSRYRDSVFRSYFNEPVRLLSLCNAVLATQYTNPDELNINTLKGIFFDKQKNDISCIIDNHFLVLVEHQTGVNENMPFRCLSYVAELLNNLIKNKRKLYNKGLIHFPRPKFFVLYDGDKKSCCEDKCGCPTLLTAISARSNLSSPPLTLITICNSPCLGSADTFLITLLFTKLSLERIKELAKNVENN